MTNENGKLTDGNEANAKRFDELLLATGRKGVVPFVDWLHGTDFYAAPASTKFHGAREGGLLAHSLAVHDQAQLIREAQIRLRPEVGDALPADGVAICALLHDICKVNHYRRAEKFRKDKDGRWEKYPAWEADHSKMPLGHGEKSVIRLLRMGLDLTTDEILAIRWHMGAWDLSEYGDARGSFNAACDRTPLLAVLMAADGLASRISERRDVA